MLKHQNDNEQGALSIIMTIMENLKNKSFDYAERKTFDLLAHAIAQAYEDGYRDGYKARESELAVNFLDSETEYVDLGLPSGTLWSKNYEKEDDELKCLPYDIAQTYNIPTRKQWDELFEHCMFNIKCVVVWDNSVVPHRGEDSLDEVIVTGPNGNSIHFPVFGIDLPSGKEKCNHCLFWLNESCNEKQKHEKESVDMYLCKQWQTTGRKDKIGRLQAVVTGTFSGYALPLRLVRNK